MAEVEAPDQVRQWGFMDMDLIRYLSVNLPPRIVLSLHGRGEPLLFPELATALDLLAQDDRVLHFDSNVKLLMEKLDDVIGRLDVLTVSLLEGNSMKEQEEQLRIVRRFILAKREHKPRIIIRATGEIPELEAWVDLKLPIVTRPLHKREGRSGYKRKPVIPEFGICLEMLQRLFIAYNGEVRPCVRSDIWGENIIGNLKHEELQDIWESEARIKRVHEHIEGNRLGFCQTCDYWGVPRG